uniref:NADH-ubiquinone oxidoreductase chain 5 n=1 Tax=Plasmodiophora brassicae TaxID=37360 RepID=A0A3P3YW70_PLABS|nr:0e4315bb-d132-4d5a-aa67-7e5f9936a19d [Plasmodiophora brassicae]
MLSLIIFLPLFSSFCSGLFGCWIGAKGVAFITFLSLLGSLILTCNYLSFISFYLVSNYVSVLSWMKLGSFYVTWSFCFDSLSSLMAVLVTVVSCLVYLYSLAYMLEDPHIVRFSCYISLFLWILLVLVSSENFVQLFFGWEGVGLCSYLLINFWYIRLQANKAAIQALMVNKIGDIGVLLGICSIFSLYRSVEFSIIFALTSYMQGESFILSIFNVNGLLMIGLFLFVGVVGKSAQLGLHTWLPSAMEGPTPVSALIHAATMVTAGIFLIIRCSEFFEYVDFILVCLVLLGALTAFFAATVGLFQNDLKRVIAYSTCSQLGYMAFSCGLSAYSVAFFHLVNHGYFKALLFLSAGSVIHGFSDEQDLRRMGGLGKVYPLTYCSILIGSFALMGFPFLSGFYSKDLILEITFIQHTVASFFVYCLGVFSAFFTAFYSFRVIYLTFIVPTNSTRQFILRIHESPLLIIIPLCILSMGSVFSGFLLKDMFIGLGSVFLGNSIFRMAGRFDLIEAEILPVEVKLVPLIVSLGGVLAVICINYVYRQTAFYLKISNKYLMKYYSFFNQKWYIDGIYNVYCIKHFFNFGYLVPFQMLDKGFIELVGPFGVSSKFNIISRKISEFQTGLIYHYTFVISVGVLVYINILSIFNAVSVFIELEGILVYIFISYIILL